MLIDLLAGVAIIGAVTGAPAMYASVGGQLYTGWMAEKKNELLMQYFEEGYNPKALQAKKERWKEGMALALGATPKDEDFGVAYHCVTVTRATLEKMREFYLFKKDGECVAEVSDHLVEELCGDYFLDESNREHFSTAVGRRMRCMRTAFDFVDHRREAEARKRAPERFGAWVQNEYGVKPQK